MDEITNEITLSAFSLLVKDLLAVFQSLNEGVISALDQYIEMSKIDAKDALQIYKKFVKQTEKVVEYLGAAKKIQDRLGIIIPNLKHVNILILLISINILSIILTFLFMFLGTYFLNSISRRLCQRSRF